MLEMSRANLSLETIDIYYIHNPETQLEARSSARSSSRGCATAFEFLETAAADGKIGVYGTATWNGFRAAPTERGCLSLDELMAIGARSRRRRASLSRDPACLTTSRCPRRSRARIRSSGRQKATTLDRRRARSGSAVCASASLLQGQLSRGTAADCRRDAFGGFATDAQRSIQFVRSTPGVDVALVGMKSVEHVRDTLAAAAHPPASVDELMKLFRPSDEKK